MAPRYYIRFEPGHGWDVIDSLHDCVVDTSCDPHCCASDAQGACDELNASYAEDMAWEAQVAADNAATDARRVA